MEDFTGVLDAFTFYKEKFKSILNHALKEILKLSRRDSIALCKYSILSTESNLKS